MSPNVNVVIRQITMHVIKVIINYATMVLSPLSRLFLGVCHVHVIGDTLVSSDISRRHQTCYRVATGMLTLDIRISNTPFRQLYSYTFGIVASAL